MVSNVGVECPCIVAWRATGSRTTPDSREKKRRWEDRSRFCTEKISSKESGP
jgi:hypothetical protein